MSCKGKLLKVFYVHNNPSIHWNVLSCGIMLSKLSPEWYHENPTYIKWMVDAVVNALNYTCKCMKSEILFWKLRAIRRTLNSEYTCMLWARNMFRAPPLSKVSWSSSLASRMTWLKVAGDAPTEFHYSPFDPSLFTVTGCYESRDSSQPILCGCGVRSWSAYAICVREHP